MRPWKLALLLALGWFGLVIVVAVLHTEVLIRDISPELDARLSEGYGQAAAVGAILVGVLAYHYQIRRDRR